MRRTTRASRPASPRRLRGCPASPRSIRSAAFRSRSAGESPTLGAADFSTIAERNKLRFIGVADTRSIGENAAGHQRSAGERSVRHQVPYRARRLRSASTRLRGRRTFTVAAIYNDYSSDAGRHSDGRAYLRSALSRRLGQLHRHLRQAGRRSGETAQRRRAQRFAACASTPRRRASCAGWSFTIFNRTFAITYALYVISITIAVLGVVSTLFALVLERRREIGLMRYLGLRTRDVRHDGIL